jgi:hypothetical protein
MIGWGMGLDGHGCGVQTTVMKYGFVMIDIESGFASSIS